MKITEDNFEIFLIEKPKENATIIEGFPGLGFISTIVSNYLVKHLNAKFIGHIFNKKLPPFVTIHENKIIYPIEIYYDESQNLIIIQASTGVEGVEYDIADTIIYLANKIKAKRILSIEGITSMENIYPESSIFFFTTNKKEENNLMKIGIKKIEEGIIVGVTGALLLRSKDIPLVSLFIQTHSDMPDNRASAHIIKVLDKYLNLKVDYKPLLKKAEEIERKIRDIIKKFTEAKKEVQRKRVLYAG